MKQSFSVLHLTVGAEPFWLSASCIYQWKHKMLIVRHWRDECDSCWVNPTTLLGHVVHTITLYPSDPSSPPVSLRLSLRPSTVREGKNAWAQRESEERLREGGKAVSNVSPDYHQGRSRADRNTGIQALLSYSLLVSI